MQLTQVLSKDCTRRVDACQSKKRALEIISELAAERLGVSEKEIFDSLFNREKLGSTGIGQGIAIPHGRVENNLPPTAVFIRCDQPIGYDSIDKQPVDLLFALIVPEEENKQYLQILAAAAEKLHNKQICKSLRQAESDEQMYQIITS
ncbi:PTS IIA-like nitrogen regulatory protein PtsN [Celerinatantimonas sp. MCCC 1A17872]|uniref:PTS IIA-like nitrogen regulatory protein PtsN n=1 Tax=Celerinatantimonas sp. MCCC 1A17872 TaxID=3177514 RepID=UPI0038BF98D0